MLNKQHIPQLINSMQAVIIAGGKGTRLRPLTYGCPKPMLPLVDRPFLEWMINRCREASVCDILLNVQYQARQEILTLVRHSVSLEKLALDFAH